MFIEARSRITIKEQGSYIMENRANLFKITKNGRVFFENKDNMKLLEINLNSISDQFQSKFKKFISNPVFYDERALGIRPAKKVHGANPISKLSEMAKSLISKVSDCLLILRRTRG